MVCPEQQHLRTAPSSPRTWLPLYRRIAFTFRVCPQRKRSALPILQQFQPGCRSCPIHTATPGTLSMAGSREPRRPPGPAGSPPCAAPGPALSASHARHIIHISACGIPEQSPEFITVSRQCILFVTCIIPRPPCTQRLGGNHKSKQKFCNMVGVYGADLPQAWRTRRRSPATTAWRMRRRWCLSCSAPHIHGSCGTAIRDMLWDAYNNKRQPS